MGILSLILIFYVQYVTSLQIEQYYYIFKYRDKEYIFNKFAF